MPIPFFPIVSTLSSLANTAWDAYQKSRHTRELLLAHKDNLQAHEALAKRVEELENTSLEQSRLLGEVSKDLEQFAKAVQVELENAQRRHIALSRALIGTAALAITALALALWSTFK